MVGDYVKNGGAEEDKRISWQGYAGAVTTDDLDAIVIAVTVNDVFYDGGVILDSKHHAAAQSLARLVSKVHKICLSERYRFYYITYLKLSRNYIFT